MENHPITALYMRIASLEAEVHHLKGQLVNAAAGGNYLIELVGAHRIQNARNPQQGAIEASQKQLEQQITQLLEENKRLKAHVIADLEQKNASLQTKVDAVIKTNIALERQLEPFRNAARIGRQQKQREHAETSGELGSWARGDAFASNDYRDGASHVVSEHVDRWVRSNNWPSDTEDCKRGPTQLVDLLTSVSEQGLGQRDSASATAEVESRLSMDAGCSTSSAAIKKSEKSTEKLVAVKNESPSTPQRLIDDTVIHIETQCGQTFKVHAPPSLTSSEEAAKRTLRHENRSLQAREISVNEHNSLSGNVAWIEDYDQEEYKSYWYGYARQHPEHGPRQWREYYEAEIRPAYLKKMAAGSKQPAVEEASVSSGEDKKSVVPRASPKSSVRKDSMFAHANGAAEARSSVVEFAVSPFPLIGMTIEEEEAEVSAYVAATEATTTIPEQPKPAASQPQTQPTAEKKPFIRYNISEMKQCRPFARSVVRNNHRIAPTEPDFSTVLEMRNLREMPMRAVAKGEVKEISIKAPSSAASSSPKGKRSRISGFC
jgi:hypothetical protein